MAEEKNPCLTCEVEQRCCRNLSGLKLSKEEYEKYFMKFGYRLSISQFQKYFIVSTHENLPCPYWNENGCRIYKNRPIDCRIFPYELAEMTENWRMIKIAFHERTDCPHREEVFMPIEEVKKLMKNLARSVYGYRKPIKIQYIPESFRPSLLDGILASAKAWWSKNEK